MVGGWLTDGRQKMRVCGWHSRGRPDAGEGRSCHADAAPGGRAAAHGIPAAAAAAAHTAHPGLFVGLAGPWVGRVGFESACALDHAGGEVTSAEGQEHWHYLCSALVLLGLAVGCACAPGVGRRVCVRTWDGWALVGFESACALALGLGSVVLWFLRSVRTLESFIDCRWRIGLLVESVLLAGDHQQADPAVAQPGAAASPAAVAAVAIAPTAADT